MNNLFEEKNVVLLSREELENMIQNKVSEATSMNHEQQQLAPLSPNEKYGLYMTREEVAKMLKVSFPTLWRWSKDGILIPQKVGNRKVLYKTQTVLDLLNDENRA